MTRFLGIFTPCRGSQRVSLSTKIEQEWNCLFFSMSTLQRIILDRAILSRNLQVTSTIFSWYLLQQTLFPNVSYKCIVFQALQYTLLRTISTYKYYYLSMYPKNIECTLYVIYLLRWFKTLWSYLIAFLCNLWGYTSCYPMSHFRRRNKKFFQALFLPLYCYPLKGFV